MTLGNAVIERARSHLATDAPLLAHVKVDQGLTLQTVQQISKIYLVRRNLGKEENLHEVVQVMNREIASWPSNINERAEWCLATAASLKNPTHRPHNAISAVTKLAWFLRPTDWTVYDSFARKGLASGGLPAGTKLRNFYKTLDEQGFLAAAQKIDGILAQSAWPDIHGTRVLDVFLMIKGGLSIPAMDPIGQGAFLATLPSNAGNGLRQLADKIETEMAEDPFIKFVAQE